MDITVSQFWDNIASTTGGLIQDFFPVVYIFLGLLIALIAVYLIVNAVLKAFHNL